MEGYGYTYQCYSTYNYTNTTDESFEPDKRRPFVPSIPNSNHNSEGYVTNKTIVPVVSRPYGDEYRHGSPTKAYPIRDDDDRQRSPVHGRLQNVNEFLTKVQNEASRPARFATTDWRQSPESTGYDGANDYGNYDNYSKKEGYRPIGGSIPNDNCFGNGYGNKGKEGHKPIGSSIGNDNYDRYQPAENYSSLESNRISPRGRSRPNISSGWTARPRNGTQLSKPTNNIGKAIGLLKEAVKLTSSGHGGRQKDDGYYNYQRSQLREPSRIDKAVEPVEAERLKNVLMAPPQSRPIVPVEPTASNRDEYRESIDRRDAQRRYGNNNLKSRPTSTMDSREAEKKYNGTRV